MKKNNQDLIRFFDSLDGEIMKDEQMILTSTFGGTNGVCDSNGKCETNNCSGGNCSKGCGGNGSQDDTAAPKE